MAVALTVLVLLPVSASAEAAKTVCVGRVTMSEYNRVDENTACTATMLSTWRKAPNISMGTSTSKMNEHLAKPIDTKLLYGTLEKYLENR